MNGVLTRHLLHRIQLLTFRLFYFLPPSENTIQLHPIHRQWNNCYFSKIIWPPPISWKLEDCWLLEVGTVFQFSIIRPLNIWTAIEPGMPEHESLTKLLFLKQTDGQLQPLFPVKLIVIVFKLLLLCHRVRLLCSKDACTQRKRAFWASHVHHRHHDYQTKEEKIMINLSSFTVSWIMTWSSPSSHSQIRVVLVHMLCNNLSRTSNF